jgi:hypothetical protein
VFGAPESARPPAIHGALRLSHAAQTFYGLGKNRVIARGGIPDVISCIDALTGRILWSKVTDRFAHWFFENETLYFGSMIDGRCAYLALEAQTGKTVWQTAIAGSYKIWHGAGPYLKNEWILFTTPSALVALDKTTGKKQFQTKLADYNEQVKPFIWNDLLILLGAKAKPCFYGYDMETGELKLTVPAKKGASYQTSARADLALVGDECWYFSDDAKLRCVNLRSGEETAYPLPAPIKKQGIFQYELSELSETSGILRIATSFVQKIDHFEIDFDTREKVYGQGEEKPWKRQGNRWDYAKIGGDKENLSIEVGGQTVNIPDLGGDCRLWEDFQLENGAKLVLQRVVKNEDEESEEEESVLYLVY